MKCIPVCSFLMALALLGSACQTGSASLDDPAFARVKSAMSYYEAGNKNAFDEQLSPSERAIGAQCPGGAQYSCLQTMYKNFAAEQHTAAQSPASFTFLLYGKQTTENVKMVLVEGNWGGNPLVISCQVFFVIQDGSLWLIDNIDNPDAVTCQQRSESLTQNLFGPTTAPVLPPSPTGR